jgi:hypothetical protein
VLVDGIRTDGGNHDGGALAIGPDGLLYVGVGDTGRGDAGPPGASTNPYAQDLQRLEGKILRIGLDGSTPPDNPFADRGGKRARVWAYGFRNPFRIAFDPIVPGPRLLWIGDVGQEHVGGDRRRRRRAATSAGRAARARAANACPGPIGGARARLPPPGGAEDGVSVTGGVHYDGRQFDDSHRGATSSATSGSTSCARAA